MKTKCLAIGIILLFVLIVGNPITGLSSNRDDTTPPVTTISLNPPEPDGENGWYVSPVAVTLNATDNESGVNAIYYQINQEGWIVYIGTFEIQRCGIIIVQFYSVDNAGNIEIPKQVEIKIDKSHPITSCYAPPNGNNGWYICNISVTLNATDDLSGVNVTYYKTLNTPLWLIYTAPFILITENWVTYYSVDNAGNQESPATFHFFKMDTAPPIIVMDYTWEKIGATYNIIVTATCSDAMSGMQKVEFYFNGELQETITGAGPDYVWTYQYTLLQNVVIKGVAYDYAGWTNSAELHNPRCSSTQSHCHVMKFYLLHNQLMNIFLE